MMNSRWSNRWQRAVSGLLLLLVPAGSAAAQATVNAPAPPANLSPGHDRASEQRASDEVKARRAWVSAAIAEGAAGAARVGLVLRSPTPADRAAAIFVLASIRASQAVPVVGLLLASDADASVRLQAAEALGAFASADGVAALVRAADSDTNRDVRVRSIASLGRIDSPAAADSIRRILSSARSDEERQAAALAAGHRRIVTARPALISLAQNPAASDRMRAAATAALGLMGGGDALTVVLALTHDSSPIVRFNAVDALDVLQDPSAVGVLTQVLEMRSEEQYIRIRAASALARFKTPEAASALRETARGADEFMAMHAVVAMVQSDPAQARDLATALRARSHDPFVVDIAGRVAQGLPLPWGQR